MTVGLVGKTNNRHGFRTCVSCVEQKEIPSRVGGEEWEGDLLTVKSIE